MTPDQLKQLKSWTEERDQLLAELVSLRSQHTDMIKANQVLGINHSSLNKSITESTARVELMEKHEEDRSLLITQELASKIIEKTKLESSMALIKKDFDTLSSQKEMLQNDIAVLLPVLERVTWQVGELNKTVASVVGVNKENTKQVDILISSLRNALSEINPKK